MYGYRSTCISLLIILLLIDLGLLYNFSPQPLSIVLDKSFYHIHDTIKATVYGPPGKYISIEIRDPKNILVYWNQTAVPSQGYVNLSIFILDYWRYGRYTIYVSIPRGPRITETFMVGERVESYIVLYSTLNTTDTYNKNSFYIVLYPPINTSVLVKVLNIYGEEICFKNILLKNGFGEFLLKFNGTGKYILNACWGGNEYYNSTYNICRVNVVDKRVDKYFLDYDIELSKNIVSIDENLTISIKPIGKVDLVIYNPFYRKIFYNVDNIIFNPNTAGIWLCYIRPRGNLLRSRPKIFYVKKRVNVTLSLGQGIAYKREKMRLVVEIDDERCFGEVNLYLWNSGEWILIDSGEIQYNMANLYWRTNREGTYLLMAVWSGDAMHFKSKSNLLNINVYARNLSITFETVDNHNRILPGSKIIVENTMYDTRQGRLSLTLKDNVYNVTVVWRNVSVYQGYINISSETVYRIKCRVYDLTVKLVGWIFNPIMDEAVYIEGNGIKMTQISDKAGQVYFRQLPVGNYTLKTSIYEKKIFLDRDMVIEIRYPPPWEEIKIALIIIIAVIIAILILRRYVKIEIVIEKEED